MTTSKKISDFLGSQDLTGGYLTFVSNGQNFKISTADFLAGLSVAGTLEQIGPVTATPVLELPTGIRNLENGSGVKSSISPENGITLDHNFVSGDDIAILTNATESQPLIRSLIAGSGISITVADDSLLLSAGTTKQEEVSGDYDVVPLDEYVVSTGDNTIKMVARDDYTRSITLKSLSGTITIDGNGETIEGAAEVVAPASRRFILISTGYIEVA